MPDRRRLPGHLPCQTSGTLGSELRIVRAQESRTTCESVGHRAGAKCAGSGHREEAVGGRSDLVPNSPRQVILRGDGEVLAALFKLFGAHSGVDCDVVLLDEPLRVGAKLDLIATGGGRELGVWNQLAGDGAERCLHLTERCARRVFDGRGLQRASDAAGLAVKIGSVGCCRREQCRAGDCCCSEGRAETADWCGHLIPPVGEGCAYWCGGCWRRRASTVLRGSSGAQRRYSKAESSDLPDRARHARILIVGSGSPVSRASCASGIQPSNGESGGVVLVIGCS